MTPTTIFLTLDLILTPFIKATNMPRALTEAVTLPVPLPVALM